VPVTTPSFDEPVPAPPLTWLLAYRLLGLRLPAEYHPWVLRDAASKSFLTWRSIRTFVWGEVLLLVGLWARHLSLGTYPPRVWLIRLELVVLAVVLLSSRDALVRRVLRWHRIDKHGNPVEKVKPFARLSNLEAVALGAAVLVAWSAAGYVYGDFERPRGIAAAPCREADPNVLAQLAEHKTDTKAKYLTTRMVVDGDTTVVIAVTDLGRPATLPSPKPGAPTPKPDATPKPIIELWVIDPTGISRLGRKADPDATTDFPALERTDRGLNPAISRVAQCLSEKPVR
jgi:hypothetical protein